MIHRILLCGLLALAASAAALAETVKDREGAVRQDRAARENDPRWIYNDVDRGFAEARRTGKPLLVVLRCVPCLACAGIDTQVLTEGSALGPLLDRFVCVRLINANTLDLSRFQFDFDLSFTTLVFNGDGTVYGRYGSWLHQKNSQETATAGYRAALQSALDLHAGYPANRESLAGKQGAPIAYKTPVEIPGLAGKYTPFLNWSGKVVPSCVHCHQVNDGLRVTLRNQQQTLPESLIYPNPAPETVGLVLADDHVARVMSVAPGSIAARAGFLPGDDIAEFAGQPLISPADFSWALHRQPNSATVQAVIRRDSNTRTLDVQLPEGWRRATDISHRAGTWGMRAMASGGLQLQELTDAERREHGITADSMALRVRHAGEYGHHAAAKKAGFRKDDILVALEGRTNRITESQWIGSALTRFKPGSSVPATVLRGTNRLDLVLPIQ
jgi:serine protease Do